MYGYNGKILILNMTDHTYTVEPLNEEWAKTFIGGASLGARYLYEMMPPKTPVYAPESVLGFVTGPTNGSKALLGARCTVVHKSPVTLGWNDSSVGGNFGPSMRKAGFDAIFAVGKSEKPVYVYVNDGVVEFKDATHLWGLVTSEADAKIKEELGNDKVSTALIGPGGEHLSYMACVIVDTHRAAGRGGPGGVMGSKNLKGIVCCGTGVVEAYDEARLIEANKKCIEHGKPGGMGAGVVAQFKDTATSFEYDSCVLQADAPLKNWAGYPDEMTDDEMYALTGMYMDPLFKEGSLGCNSCYIKCGAKYKVITEKYNNPHATRPEYESLGAFGSMLLNGDPATAVMCNWYCNEYGYDTLSFGGTIAWAMECYEKGILTKEELGGIELKWGDTDAIIAITKKICEYEGIGVELNLASRGAARALDKGYECCVTASGIELPMHGARFNAGLSRIFQYDPTPGRHIKGGRGVPYGHRPPEVKYAYEGTGAEDAAGLLEWELSNCSGVCGFGNFLLAPWIAKEFIAAITGIDRTEEEWNIFAYRSFTLRHAFNLREGFRRKDFKIDGRAVGKPPLKNGPLTDITLDNEKLADNFYEYLGWDVKTAVPTKEFLEMCGGLECVINDLYPEG